MTRAVFSTALVACLCGTAVGAPVTTFPDASYAEDSMRNAPSGERITTIDSLFDEPTIMFSRGPAHLTPTHIKPTKPTIDPSFGNGDSAKPPKLPTTIVPLPGPAGLALAGLALIGAIRRR